MCRTAFSRSAWIATIALVSVIACTRKRTQEDHAVAPTPAPAMTEASADEPAEPSSEASQHPPPDVPAAPEATFTIVYDNVPSDMKLLSGWGFACLVDVGRSPVLFDAGNDARAVVDNLKALGRPLDSVRSVVVSHAHGDHTRGLWAFLREVEGVRVFLPHGVPSALGERVARAGGEPTRTKKPTEVVDGVVATGPLGGAIPEQALLVPTPRGVVMVVGCSHPGIETMLNRAAEIAAPQRLYGVLGGMHLHRAGPARLRRVVEGIRKHDLGLVAPAHCTGVPATARIREAFPDAFRGVKTGAVVRVGEGS